MTNEIAGAIDIGSNSILLTIARRGQSLSGVPLEILVDEAHVTGLSKGLEQSGKISEERLKHSLEILQKYRKYLDQFKVAKFEVVATEAFRKASNGADAKLAVEKILQSPLEIISGEREAELSFWSVQKEHRDSAANKIVFDIGGASTEVVLGSNAGIQKKISLKVGSVVLTEKFELQKKSSSDDVLNFLRTFIHENISWHDQAGSTLGIGVAGTMTTLIAIQNKMPVYDRNKVHGQKISIQDAQRILDLVLSKEGKDRSQSITGLSADRADVFGGGLSILVALSAAFRWSEVLCMDSGVRFGLLYEMLRC